MCVDSVSELKQQVSCHMNEWQNDDKRLSDRDHMIILSHVINSIQLEHKYHTNQCVSGTDLWSISRVQYHYLRFFEYVESLHNIWIRNGGNRRCNRSKRSSFSRNHYSNRSGTICHRQTQSIQRRRNHKSQKAF
eukprot:310248_1